MVRWSPLTCLTPAPLLPSGLLILESADNEVETLVRMNVELRYYGSGELPLQQTSNDNNATQISSWMSRDVGLTITITTHRIILIDEHEKIGGSIPLPLVQTAQKAGGPSFSSPMGSYKIELSTHAWGDLTIVFRGGEDSSYRESIKHRDDTLDAIHTALKRKAWNDRERQVMKEQLRPSRAIAAKKVGVDAIMTQNALRHRENANLADVAFGGANETGKQSTTHAHFQRNNKSSASKKEDIDAFLGEATELIKVIQKYSATIERERAAAMSSSGGSKDDDDNSGKDTEKLLVSMMDNMGMTSAISAKQAGSAYHKKLAQQLTAFLRHNEKLTRAGGMMTLTDVYCLFNRARGTNMVSPEDLIKAVDLMKELELGISKRSFASGVMVIQDDSFDDELMAKKLTELASSSMQTALDNTGNKGISESSVGGITVMDVCRTLKTSALLANEQLLSAEQMGYLCRDSTIEGVRFFPNLFESACVVSTDFSGWYLDNENMDKYRLVEEKYIGAQGFIDDSKMTGDSRPDGSELDTESTVRITQQAKPRRCITTAMNMLASGNKHVELKAMGKAINKAVTIAEILKRKMPLHQVTALSSCEMVNVYEPLEEGLDTVVNQHYISCLTITLSTDLSDIDVHNIGYQPPLSLSEMNPGDFSVQQPVAAT